MKPENKSPFKSASGRRWLMIFRIALTIVLFLLVANAEDTGNALMIVIFSALAMAAYSSV